MKYDYFLCMVDYIKTSIRIDYDCTKYRDRAELEEELARELPDDDCIMYDQTCDTSIIEEKVACNTELLKEACKELEMDFSEVSKAGAEEADHIIRVYLLPAAICAALDDLTDEYAAEL